MQPALARRRPRQRAPVHRPLEDAGRPARDQDAAGPARRPRRLQATAYRGDPDDLVFPTLTGSRRDPDNLRERVLAAVLGRADELLERRGLVPLPRRLTGHKLRHAFASILVACGEDPVSVMRQIGHTDPSFTLRVYTHMMSLDPADRERLKAVVRGERVIARQAAPPRPVELAEYEGPIVRALAERGGRAPRREIVAAVGEAMAEHHGAPDLERLPSGPPRWKPRVGKVRTRLVRRGWLAAGSGRGEWELTERSWAKARREEKRARRAPAAPALSCWTRSGSAPLASRSFPSARDAAVPSGVCGKSVGESAEVRDPSEAVEPTWAALQTVAVALLAD